MVSTAVKYFSKSEIKENQLLINKKEKKKIFRKIFGVLKELRYV